jgi:ribosomal protein S18 acetylase RimI-like enzyme
VDKDIKVSVLTVNDAKAIAAVHHQSFKGFFLTSLGVNFLAHFYAGVLKHEHSLGVGVFKDQRLIGFAIGTQKNTGFYKSILKRNWAPLLWSALPKLVNPAKAMRLLSSFAKQKSQQFVDVPMLLSICVTSTQENKGLGSELLNTFENSLRELRLNSLILFTDADNNDAVNQFYQNNNYTFVESFLQGKRKMNLYHKELNK